MVVTFDAEPAMSRPAKQTEARRTARTKASRRYQAKQLLLNPHYYRDNARRYRQRHPEGKAHHWELYVKRKLARDPNWQRRRQANYRARHPERYVGALKRIRTKIAKMRGLILWEAMRRIKASGKGQNPDVHRGNSVSAECSRYCRTMSHTKQEPIELLTVSECARRNGTVAITLRRAIARHGIVPDAVLVEGSKKLRSPLFVEPRLAELAELIDSQTNWPP